MAAVPTNVAVPAWEVYTRHQAALGVVWEDERISAICSRRCQPPLRY